MLDAGENKIGDGGLQVILRKVPEKLQQLDLPYNGISSAGLKCLLAN